MKILFCTKNDIFGAVILNRMLPLLQGHDVRVVVSDKTRPSENTVHELVEEKFLERDLPLGMIFPLLDARADAAGSARPECLTMQGVAAQFRVPLKVVLSINDADTEQELRDWAPDLIVSARFSLIFKQNILRIPRFGAYNIHPGALPGYAGLFAPFRALLNGDAALGATLHQIDTGIDTGPVYSVSYLPAQPARSVFWHIEKLYLLGLDSLLTLMDGLERGQAPLLRKQDDAAFRYFGMPGEQEFAQFRRMGYSMVSYDSYRALLQRFLPPGMAAPALPWPRAGAHAAAEAATATVPATVPG